VSFKVFEDVNMYFRLLTHAIKRSDKNAVNFVGRNPSSDNVSTSFFLNL